MPLIDEEDGALVVRIVYDGPPFSGKTTTLRALADVLGCSVSTPQEEDGRTLFFDWMSYVGGLFEGRPIRCQIVSVPGQPQLAARREYLVDTADAIVMVADTRAAELERTLAVLREVTRRCRSHDPPVGVVLQANKRDAADSVPSDELRVRLAAIAPIAMVETVATTAEGVREAFVFCVRLALDRTRALADRGELASGTHPISSPEQLLDAMSSVSVTALRPRRLEPASVERPEAEELDLLLPRVSNPREAVQYDEELFQPDPLMPVGLIWPPVDGRALVHEVAQVGIAPVRTRRGDWWASGGGWRCHSAGPALFDDVDAGRMALVEWARLHAAHRDRLSAGRTTILADAGPQRHRLWQMVRVSESLREWLAGSIAESQIEHLAADLCDAALHLLRARERLHSTRLGLPCSLWTISGDVRRSPVFVGLMPQVSDATELEPEGPQLVAREFGPLLRIVTEERDDVQELASLLAAGRAVSGEPEPGAIARALAELLRAARSEAEGGD